MTEFGYLSVLLAIILSLAITHLLQGWRGRMLAVVPVRDYWPTHAWAFILLLMCTQFWWAMFTLRERQHWTFGQFAAILGQTVLVYMATALVYPDFTGAGPVDLRAHYFAQRRHFYGLLTAAALMSVIRDFVLYHSWVGTANLIFLLIFATMGAVAFVTARESVHKTLIVIIAVLFVLYVVSLFSDLH